MIKRILLVEDETGTALVIKSRLERLGYIVHVASDGLKALELLQDESVDLVITDVVMPNMDGVDLYLALKRDKVTEDLPIIIITDKQVFRDSFSKLGVDHFVPKASDIMALLEKIKEVERQRMPIRDYHKVLVCGNDDAVMDQMQALLRERQCLTSGAKTVHEIVTKAIQMKPHLILMDVMIDDQVTTKEIIRSLKCYELLKKTPIVIYAHYRPAGLDGAAGLIQSLEDAMKDGLEAGATKYIGRFSRLTFLAQLEEFGIR